MRRLILTALLALLPSVADAGTIVLDLGGTPVTVTTTGDHDYAVADSVAKVNTQITEQNARNAADNDAALAQWNATNASRAAKVCPTGAYTLTNPPQPITEPCPEPPLPQPSLKTISPTLSREQWVAEQVRGVLDGLGKSYRDRMLGTARDAFYAVPAASKAAVCAALGLAGKLPECP